MEIEKLQAAVEAILFTMGDSVELEKIAAAIGHDYETTRKIVHTLMDRCEEEDRGVRIIELEKENKDMENKLRKSFPVHIITYLTICSFVMGVCITLLVLTYLYDICLINPYYIICTLLISLTLLCTAAVATKDWKDYISGK